MAELNNDALHERNLDQARHLTSQVTLEESNRYYKIIEKKYKEYIDQYLRNPNPAPPGPRLVQRRALFQLEPGKYVNKASVETFFNEKMALKVVLKDTMMKTVYVLNHLADREESDLAPNCDILKDPRTRTVINSVLHYVQQNKERHLQAMATEGDPHEMNPFNILSQENASKVMFARLAKGIAWEDPIVSWAITLATGLRFDSASTMKIDKIIIVQDLPPRGIYTPHDGKLWSDTLRVQSERGDERMLGFIIPPQDQKKKNKGKTALKYEGVGAYRHKRTERCSSSALAFSLMWKMHHQQNQFSFFKKDHVPPNRTCWKEVKIFDLSYGTAYDQYTKMLEEAGVPEWLKKTHMR